MKISESQLKLVNEQVQRLVASGNYFGRRLREAGVTEVRTESDFLALPFSEKEDLRNCYPLGGLRGGRAPDRAHPLQLGHHGHARDHPLHRQGTSTTGPSSFRRCYELAGITAEDRIQITPGYGLWTAGIGFQAGAEKLGAMVVPMGPGNTEKQLQFMVDLQTTGHRRHVELCLAARGGGREARHARPDCPHQGRHRLRALGAASCASA